MLASHCVTPSGEDCMPMLYDKQLEDALGVTSFFRSQWVVRCCP